MPTGCQNVQMCAVKRGDQRQMVLDMESVSVNSIGANALAVQNAKWLSALQFLELFRCALPVLISISSERRVVEKMNLNTLNVFEFGPPAASARDHRHMVTSLGQPGA